MMYNSQLSYFILAAEEDSFTKASKKLFLSPAAFIKHINHLEAELGLKLLNRTPRGITLTPAGEIIFKAAKQIITISDQAIDSAQSLENTSNNSIKIGNSLLYPSQPLFNQLLPILNQNFKIKLQVVPIPDATDAKNSPVKMLNNQIDIFAGIFPSDMWNYSCQGLKLADLPLRIAVPHNSDLADKKWLDLSDLQNRTLFMVEPNSTQYIDVVRQQLQKDYPRIKIKTVPPYDIDTFNRVVANNKLILTVDIWLNAHPSLKILPVKWDYTVPWGIIYSLYPSKNTENFIETVYANLVNSK
ncbi:LysR family transcriptional regulator [Ligilactobacillus murinus]|uniref:LysR family transcriptional regulator n=1 Tax=Ligilactobacillus murinus TaxID=1622 RepID=UPI00296AC185|nr:LysR family transcriptional regulator [Ligilactobacillus murinus]WOY89532.1 LysR family transcriptional regulator [Ligilactobacillus murinus]